MKFSTKTLVANDDWFSPAVASVSRRQSLRSGTAGLAGCALGDPVGGGRND